MSVRELFWEPPDWMEDESVQLRVCRLLDTQPEAYQRELDADIEEWFESKDQMRLRLTVFAITHGFAAIKKASRQDYVVFQCVHHGVETRNYRQLEEHIERDQAGRIVSQRQREHTKIRGKDCPWKVTGFRTNDGRWRMKVKCLEHSHPPHPDPLSYAQNKALTREHQDALNIALTHRQAGISHASSNRILLQQGLSLSSNEYYNLDRMLFKELVDSSSFSQLQHVLKTHQFDHIYQPRIEQNGVVLMDKIAFWNSSMRSYARRYSAGFLIEIDGTFSTNKPGLTLMTVVGVDNESCTFPVLFYFAMKESNDVFEFILDTLSKAIFEGVLNPTVLMADQAPGLISVMTENQRFIPGLKLQYCQWHAAENLRCRLLKVSGYDQNAIRAIVDACWAYLKSATSEELTRNRHQLKELLLAPEKAYLERIWIPKERQLVTHFTSQTGNLGVISSQRVEGSHILHKKHLHPSRNLIRTMEELTNNIKLRFSHLTRKSNEALSKQRRLLDSRGLNQLVGKISDFALQKVQFEWDEAKVQINNLISNDEVDNLACSCNLNVQFGLPCRHQLIQVLRSQLCIPISIIHPRWWIKGLEIDIFISNWSPRFEASNESPGLEANKVLNTDVTLNQPITTPEMRTLNSTQPITVSNLQAEALPISEQSIQANFQQELHRIADLASTLGPGLGTALMIKGINISKQLRQYAQRREQSENDVRIPITEKDQSRLVWRHKKHRATDRALTATELAERNLRRQQQKVRKAQIALEKAKGKETSQLLQIGLGDLSKDTQEQEQAIPQKSIGSCIQVLPRRSMIDLSGDLSESSEDSDSSLELIEELIKPQEAPIRPRKRAMSPGTRADWVEFMTEPPIGRAQGPTQAQEPPNTQEDPENQGRARRRRVILDYRQLHSTGIRSAR